MRTRIAILALLLTLLAPAVALGCSIAVAPPARPHIAADDLRFLHRTERTRGAWGLGEEWSSRRMGLVEQIHPRFLRRPVSAAYAQQRSIKLLALRPFDGVYGDDDDPTTTCELVGKRVYAATHLLVRETARAVSVTLVDRRTPGSTAGCSVSSTSCDDLVFRTVTLDRPIGARPIFATTFPAS